MKSSDNVINVNDFDVIYGIGNIGRQDDGLGWAFIDAIEPDAASHQKLVRHYQLFFEDVDLIRRHKRILFVDATKDVTTSQYRMERVLPKLDDSFTSHAISVQSILAMCHQCYQAHPDVWLLTIRGNSWELSLGLTPMATQNLALALEAVRSHGVYDTESAAEALHKRPNQIRTQHIDCTRIST
ncbi:hydrogenase maturation protease [Enterovibrio sp. ZSDZ35]|uniref:Hydrogenase maturation protease n=1 Tax=Enterovibrio qingdaonensis TaxID=2899818 RepID=A0ABT5QIM6_9GAMM|nr:hydrogenase maturation protease [Enterovibrio sp. ZSDZ35]MDD1780709.1 hydrogenase maturation protease [Enterovibrio sp. ZSDZ35]